MFTTSQSVTLSGHPNGPTSQSVTTSGTKMVARCQSVTTSGSKMVARCQSVTRARDLRPPEVSVGDNLGLPNGREVSSGDTCERLEPPPRCQSVTASGSKMVATSQSVAPSGHPNGAGAAILKPHGDEPSGGLGRSVGRRCVGCRRRSGRGGYAPVRGRGGSSSSGGNRRRLAGRAVGGRPRRL